MGLLRFPLEDANDGRGNLKVIRQRVRRFNGKPIGPMVQLLHLRVEGSDELE